MKKAYERRVALPTGGCKRSFARLIPATVQVEHGPRAADKLIAEFDPEAGFELSLGMKIKVH